MADALHTLADELGRKWLPDDQLSQTETARLEEALHPLQELCKRHIIVKDTCIFPLAGRVLNDPPLQRVRCIFVASDL